MTPQFKAAIFDMDGTLLNSMPAWRSLGKRFLAERGYDVPPEIVDDRQVTCMRACQVIASTYHIGMSADALFQYVLTYLPKLYKTEVQPRPGALQYVARLRERGVLCNVATATPFEYANPALKHHRFLDHMLLVYGRNDLPVEKDDPEYFQIIADKLGYAPGQCVVFEDALYAIRSAKRAGCAVYAIADDFAIPDREEIMSLADRFVWSFEELLREG